MAVVSTAALNPWDSQSERVYPSDGVWHSLNANENGGQSRDAVFCLQGNGIDRAATAGCNGAGWKQDISYTLNTIDRPAVAFGVDCRNATEYEELNGTLQAHPNGGSSVNLQNIVRTERIGSE